MQKYNFDYSYVPGEIEYSSDQISNKHLSNRVDNDFFDDTKYIVEKVIRVKRIASAKKNERWNIFENTKIVFVVDGSKLIKKEKEYLRTIDGFNFLMNQGKKGIKSMNHLKKELKKILP